MEEIKAIKEEITFSVRLKRVMRWKDEQGRLWKLDMEAASNRLRSRGMLCSKSKGDGTLRNWYYGAHEPVAFLQNAIVNELRQMRAEQMELLKDE